MDCETDLVPLNGHLVETQAKESQIAPHLHLFKVHAFPITFPFPESYYCLDSAGGFRDLNALSPQFSGACAGKVTRHRSQQEAQGGSSLVTDRLLLRSSAHSQVLAETPEQSSHLPNALTLWWCNYALQTLPTNVKSSKCSLLPHIDSTNNHDSLISKILWELLQEWI